MKCARSIESISRSNGRRPARRAAARVTDIDHRVPRRQRRATIRSATPSVGTTVSRCSIRATTPSPDHRGSSGGERRRRRPRRRGRLVSVPSTGDHDLRVRVRCQSDDSILIIGRSLHRSTTHVNGFSCPSSRRASAPSRSPGCSACGWCGSVSGRSPQSNGRQPDHRHALRSTRARWRAEHRSRTAVDGDQPMLDRLQGVRPARRQNVTLQESEARMRQFVADASHELRTPMTAVSAYAELFERGARDR